MYNVVYKKNTFCYDNESLLEITKQRIKVNALRAFLEKTNK